MRILRTTLISSCRGSGDIKIGIYAPTVMFAVNCCKLRLDTSFAVIGVYSDCLFVAAQCAHAAVGVVKLIRKHNHSLLKQWEEYGSAKIAVKCPNQAQLVRNDQLL